MLEKQTLANTGDPPQKPFPYGYVTSETQLLRMVEEREKNGLPVYGHAIAYINGERIGARVNHLGEITFGAHCENI